MADIKDNDDVVEELNDLIQLDHDAILTYEEAIAHVDTEDSEVRIDLEQFMADHRRHIADLTQVIHMLGGEPKDAGRDVKGLLLEGMTKLRSVTGTVGALKAMRMNEKLTNRAYEKAARDELPPAVQTVILRNLDDERRHLAAIKTHIARFDELDEDRDDDDEYGSRSVLDDHPNVRM